MGGMTVAPVAVAPSAVSRISRCAMCGSGVDAHSKFCSNCGSPFAPDAKATPDMAATRSLQYAVLVLIANIVVGGLAFGVIFVSSDAAQFATAALQLEVLQFLVVGTLAALAIRTGVRGLRETRGGRMGRRSWAIAGVTVSSLVGLALVVSLIATFVLFLAS